ncbi:pentatricopeptide repeat-containing protein At2g01860 [Diospyros lotus]|uniref:pentatricopeptide repeat-containing protein At2g01860 n=1 Tax=Diospyros lotus TaxID=55363 RepID=UPI002250FC4B|nr:pentatricopeptide repeat-containing protein At2g01860 [Diospyros lotus]XP_052207702.1 pentatricopeptide repeat-containing protein At2g01860 [Diospyros lotus]XP_052207703.1 pentatricopeptide repeat-containing protein At2g01860 [Diospyros lotus]XP_052207704.1 pentatricopeptide repeat-containing protein At2g01860 [Diospyros lotus]XP_052207705.1 pentatricopeptide repeat-containing protein At2g01860 [Diospyros lotus]
MSYLLSPHGLISFSDTRLHLGLEQSRIRNVRGVNSSSPRRVVLVVKLQARSCRINPPKNLRYPRRTKLPPKFVTGDLWKKQPSTDHPTSQMDWRCDETPDLPDENPMVRQDPDDGEDGNEEDRKKELGDEKECGDNIVWENDEIEAISSLFRGRIPQKLGMPKRERPLPLPFPHKIRPSGFPSPKRNARTVSSTVMPSRQSLSKRVYKNPNFLVALAKEIRSLHAEKDVSAVLSKWSGFLRKGSLSLTIRELGHMGLPKRALQTFCWAQKQPHLFPDDRILASTVEVLARTHELKMPFNMHKFTRLASRNVIVAMLRGFIKGGSLELAWKLFLAAKDSRRMLDSSIYAKLILEFGKNPDKQMLVLSLLEELEERDDLDLSLQDCTAIMKVCIRLGRFEIVESLFNWFTQLGHEPTVVMYTTLIHSRFTEKKYKEAFAVVWEMEGSNCLFDFPAYCVVIKLCVALHDLSRAVRYFSKLKEAGFSPTYGIYRDLFTIYMAFGRLAKCKAVCKEAEIAGFVLDKQMRSHLLQLQI